MIRSRFRFVASCALIAAAAAPAVGQQANLRIGYVYPAGGQRGTTFEVVVGGQFISGASHIYVSGGGVQGTMTDVIRPIAGKELNDLRIKADEMLARKAAVRNDFRALAMFRNFKNAKSVKSDAATEEKEIQELKKKYAHATWTPDDERQLAEIRKRMSSGVRKPANPAISEMVIVQLTIAADARPGQRELRLGTSSGVTNPLVFCIGDLPEFAEPASKTITEQKSAIAKTAFVPKNRKKAPEMAVTLPAVVNGQILPGEVDHFRFTATKGQRLVVAAAARALIPYLPDGVPGWFQATLGIFDEEGRELAYDDDFRFNPDPVLYYEIPADGKYRIEIKDAIYRGREDFVYRITLGELPFVTSIFPLGGPAHEKTTVQLKGWNLPTTSMTIDDRAKASGVYPLRVKNGLQASNYVPFAVDTLPECTEQESKKKSDAPQKLTLPIIVNGRINKPNDVDAFQFDAQAGQEIVAEVYARRLNSPLDSVLRLTDAAGKQLALNDDHEDKGAGLTTHHADSYLRVKLPETGTYTLYLRDTQHKGGPEYAYRLRVSAPRPDFDLRVAPSNLSLRGGASLPVTIYALRKDGFTGEIAIDLQDAPPGFKLAGGLVPADQDVVRLTLTGPSSSSSEPVPLKLQGRAQVDGREVVHPVVPAEDMMQAFEYRHLVPAQELLVAVSGRFSSKGSVRILSELPARIVAGGVAYVQIGVPSYALSDKIKLELIDPPAGITIQDVSTSREGAKITLAGDAEKAKPGLKGNLIVGAFPGKTSSKGSSKSQLGATGKPLVVLPAIPFEVVKP